MKTFFWNINHRICEKPIHPWIPALIEKTNPDVVALSEYVDAESRTAFKSSLKAMGFVNQHVTPKIGRHNQIFVAAKDVIVGPNSSENAPDSTVRTNYCTFAVRGRSVYAMRVPAYKSTAEKNAAWAFYLEEIAMTKPDIVIGDLNVDPASKAKGHLASIEALGYARVSIPGASFWTLNGLPKVLDHAFVRKPLIAKGEYVTSLGENQLIGKSGAFASDHAAILIETN